MVIPQTKREDCRKEGARVFMRKEKEKGPHLENQSICKGRDHCFIDGDGSHIPEYSNTCATDLRGKPTMFSLQNVGVRVTAWDV